MAKRKSEQELGASAFADRVLVPAGPEPVPVSAHSGDAPLREPTARPPGDGWEWGRFDFMGTPVWGWRRPRARKRADG